MKKVALAVALLLAMAASVQAAPIVLASIVPDPTVTNMPFALEDLGAGTTTGFIDGDPYLTSTGTVITFTGDSGIYGGDVSVARSPFRTDTGAADDLYYLNARAGDSVVLTYTTAQTAFNLLWGSVDPNPSTYNVLTFSGDYGTQVVTAEMVVAGLSGVQSGRSNLAVSIWGLNPFKTITATASQEAFEFVPGVPVPDGGATLALLGCALLGLGALRQRLRG